MKRLAVTSLVSLVVAIGEAVAQGPALGLSAGVALPGGALGARRTAAPYVAMSALMRSPERVARFRIDADVARFWGRTQPGFMGPIEYGDLTVMSALGQLVLGQRGGEGFYTLFGIGLHWMSIPGDPNPYGIIWGLGTGLGARIPIRAVALEVELRAHAILSDYGNPEFVPSYYYPMTLGLRF